MNKLGSFLLAVVICCTVVNSFADTGKPGSISGRVTLKDGTPMAYAQIFIFNESSGAPPSFDRYWRVPDEVIQADGEGRFRAILAKGKYYLGAIKRKSGDEIGPLQNGDLFLPFYADGQPISYTVTNGSSMDLGTVSGAEPFSGAILKSGDGITAIAGSVTDSDGKPVENALIFAFTSSAMMGKPLFISEKTGKDGKYMLRVYQGGQYYLKIRSSYGGGAMKSGEIMGSYGQDEPAPVTVKTGNILNGINITGMYFSGQGPKSNSKRSK